VQQEDGGQAPGGPLAGASPGLIPSRPT
jgi:hypothetical protein